MFDLFEMLTSDLGVAMISLWACFIVYAVWYSARAKDYAPITSAEARQLWIIHQQDSHCSSRKWRQLKKRDTMVGFECGCGYKYMQHRPLVARLPSAGVHSGTGAFSVAGPRNRTS